MGLPNDVYHQIFSCLPPETLFSCRLLDRSVGEIATYHAFRHRRLDDINDVQSFVNVAKSDRFRHLVRELTIDTRLVGFSYQCNHSFRPSRDFFRALAYIRFFTSLLTLNLRFNQWSGPDTRDGVIMEETHDFRHLVLDIVFRALAGDWPQAHQPVREESLVSFSRDDRGTLPPVPTEGTLLLDNEVIRPINIQTLTVSNLAIFHDEKLMKSPAFNKVMSSKSLTAVKLLIAKETTDTSLRHPRWFREPYDFCNQLPNTWLSPAVAQNLRTLSLFFQEYWGWDPKVDFRAINPGRGANSGLPNLRVLALGNYVFSHDWQVDWIASSVGHDNGRGGLEELYLDDCPIMWQARILAPLDDSKTTHQLADGSNFEYSNSGYPIAESMYGDGPQSWNPQKFAFDLRWDRVLSYWKNHMTALKVFKMGHGSWEPDGSRPVLRSCRTPRLLEVPTDIEPGEAVLRLKIQVEHDLKYRRSRLEDTMHLDYDCPSPDTQPIEMHDWHTKYRFGLGMKQQPEYILQYVHFDIVLKPPWIERDNVRDMIRDEGIKAYNAASQRDADAYDEFLSIVEGRS